MQFTTILASSILSSSILAFATPTSPAPATATYPAITLQVYEEISGIRSNTTVPGDNVPRSIERLFQETAIGDAGYNATSAQLVKFVDSSLCLLVNGNVTIQLDARWKNYADFDGDRGVSVPTYIGGFTFQCTQDAPST